MNFEGNSTPTPRLWIISEILPAPQHLRWTVKLTSEKHFQLHCYQTHVALHFPTFRFNSTHYLMPVEDRIALNSHSLNHDCFVLPHWRSEEWNIQDDMEISPASVSLLSLSAMRALVPRSSTPSISTALGLRTHNSLTKAHPHGQGHAHSGMPRWQMELAERRERAMPWFDIYSIRAWCKLCHGPLVWMKSSKCVLLLFRCLWVKDRRLQVEERPITPAQFCPPGMWGGVVWLVFAKWPLLPLFFFLIFF